MATATAVRARRRPQPPSLKERVLTAAIEEFSALGYHGSSLRSIASRSHATKPMIYYHYQNKDGLYAAAVRHQLEQLEEQIRNRFAERGDSVGRLEAFARAYLTAFLFDFPGLAVGLRELPTVPSPLFEEIATAHGRMVVAQLREMLRDGIERHELRPLDVDNCARAIIAIMHYYIRGSGLETHAAREAATSQIVDYYAAGLLVGAPRSRLD